MGFTPEPAPGPVIVICDGSGKIKFGCVIIPRMINSCMLKFLVIVFLCAIAAQGVSAQSEEDLLDQLRADYAALLDARMELDQAAKSGSINDAEQADYAAWIQQLGDQFTEVCRRLSAHSTRLIPADIPCTEFTSAYFAPAGIDIEQENTEAEKTAAMVGQFNDSLGEFDEKLLREQDRVKAQKPRVESAGSGAGAGGQSGGKSGGESGEEEGGESGAESGAESESGEQIENGQEGQRPNESDAGSDQSSSGARGSSTRGSQSNIPDDIPDGSDDDVVARQLREAAEKEKDPELQKKLWEEYKRYKNGQ